MHRVSQKNVSHKKNFNLYFDVLYLCFHSSKKPSEDIDSQDSDERDPHCFSQKRVQLSDKNVNLDQIMNLFRV